MNEFDNRGHLYTQAVLTRFWITHNCVLTGLLNEPFVNIGTLISKLLMFQEQVSSESSVIQTYPEEDKLDRS